MPGNLGNHFVGSEILAGKKWDSQILFRNFTYMYSYKINYPIH